MSEKELPALRLALPDTAPSASPLQPHFPSPQSARLISRRSSVSVFLLPRTARTAQHKGKLSSAKSYTHRFCKDDSERDVILFSALGTLLTRVSWPSPAASLTTSHPAPPLAFGHRAPAPGTFWTFTFPVLHHAGV